VSFRLVETALFRRQLNSWRLDDVTRIDVYLRLHQLQDNPQLLLQQSTSPPGGMIYAFSFVDSANRILEHRFEFLVLYSQDEQSLILASGVYAPQYGYF
jgi:hypothetical protein